MNDFIGIQTEFFHEDTLQIVIEDHVFSPIYEILSEKETSNVENILGMSRTSFPKLRDKDPYVIFHGLNKNIVVRIYRINKIGAKYSIMYKVVY